MRGFFAERYSDAEELLYFYDRWADGYRSIFAPPVCELSMYQRIHSAVHVQTRTDNHRGVRLSNIVKVAGRAMEKTLHFRPLCSTISEQLKTLFWITF